jgi:hypothetical protein
MKYNKCLICGLLIFIAQIQLSCKKEWLDVKANIQQAVPSSLSDFQALMDNGTTQLNFWGPGLAELASDGHYSTDDAWQSADNTTKNGYTWSHDYAYKNVDDWTSSYNSVFICNLVLEGLQKVVIGNSSDQQALNNIKGQALFFRGYTFFDVAQMWAPPLDSSKYNTDLGIPLRMSSDITLPSVQATVHNTYEQILGDLKMSATLLPVKSLYLRPTQQAAFAALARVYLAIGSYDSAFTYSNRCLNISADLLDYNTLDPTAGNIGYLNKEVLFQKLIPCNYDYSGFLSYNCLIDQDLFMSYDSNDLRRSLFFSINSDSSISFQGNYNNNSNLFCGLATDEQYLIRAECEVRNGSVSAGMSDLNGLLQTRWTTGTFLPFIATNSDDALSQVLTERRKELLLRGLRWQDLRRLNKDNRFKVTLSRTINSNTYTIAPSSFRYTFPIPDDIIQLSTLKQNPGW